MVTDVDRLRAQISRLREQAEAAKSASPFKGEWIDLGDLRTYFPEPETDHIATWSPSSVLLVLDGWERQLVGHQAALAEHSVLVSGTCMRCRGWVDPVYRCPDYRRAKAGLADLARLVDTINGSSR